MNLKKHSNCLSQAIPPIKSWLPAMGTVLSVIFISLYPLSEKEMRKITNQLNDKRK